MRKGEDHVDVSRWKKFQAAFGEPAFASIPLAFWAMPIAARVVRDDAVSAAGTLIDMAAEHGRPAAFNSRQDFQMQTRYPSTATFDELLSCCTDKIGHL